MDSSYEVREQLSGQIFHGHPDQSVLRAMENQGIRCVPVGCRGGGCGVCLVQVVSGEFECGRMSYRHVSTEAHAQGWVLACQLYPRSDLVIEHYPGVDVSGSKLG
ncbi:2Fe-2S iron-sulfur cluster binding domain-containing protein [Pseudomonas sp. MAP12]|uniref:2Fe-2S iron-sulfur cluster binding domain-containing protein n=1 Tax=Geopseudomonas aromaticivorans TaxID=2849492 RepID=A0ABS6MWD3_9GAMM|nr:2Fe-2S iron-sulfur cluster binding domain-containing protein [Pseudomonas aromaticivorans]MBV2132587.1 2Fe-2S iron-sulfur cluster binding domain-containing protein [Pseudomonas aromaticivorans]